MNGLLQCVVGMGRFQCVKEIGRLQYIKGMGRLHYGLQLFLNGGDGDDRFYITVVF